MAVTTADQLNATWVKLADVVAMGARFDETHHRIVFTDGSAGRLEDLSRYPPKSDVHGFPLFYFRAIP